MSYSNAAATYREREVLSASPEKLVVIVFDYLLVNLRRAHMAIDAGNIEQRTHALMKAGDAVMELLVSTDVERGGEIAQNLRSLYTFALRELLAIGRTPDAKRVDKLTEVMTNLRDAFATIASQSAARTTAA